MTEPPPITVDLHVHLFPERMFEAVWRFFDGWRWGVHRESAAQIAATLASHGVTLTTGLSYAHRPGVARELNRFMAEAGQQHEIFRPFASVHVDDEDLDSQVDEIIDSPHLFGFKFQPLVQGYRLHDPRLDRLYARCQEADFPILFHAGTAPVANEFLGFEQFRKVLERFPELRLCVAHMGGYEFDAFLTALDDHPRMYLDTTMINVRTDLFDTTWRGDAEHLARHADRICFGSDWPNVPYPYQEALDSLSRFPLPAEALPGLRGGNALRFLKLVP